MVKLHFYRPASLLGRAICWITRKAFSHVAIEHDWHGSTFFSTAIEPQGVIGMRDAAVEQGEETYEIPFPIDEEWAFDWLSHKWGMQYGWRDLVMFPFKRRAWRTNYKGYICSEYALLFLAAAVEVAVKGNQFPAEYRVNGRLIVAAALSNPSKVSPGGLYKIVTGTHPAP